MTCVYGLYFRIDGVYMTSSSQSLSCISLRHHKELSHLLPDDVDAFIKLREKQFLEVALDVQEPMIELFQYEHLGIDLHSPKDVNEFSVVEACLQKFHHVSPAIIVECISITDKYAAIR